uniref:Hikeshi-like C-terminal domain-containing protein n=1 Tax=Tetraselmis sp. GSL018 TaxID=582737 RepID=A0A061QT79_9CHLO
MALFGVFFVGQSFPITDQNFVRADPTHWVLDVTAAVKPQHEELKEVAFFLPQPGALDPNMGLGLYVSVGGSEWSYRGCICNAHPSEVMPLQWPKNLAGTPGAAQIGISVEPLAEVMGKEGSKLGAREDFAKRVAMDLFNFMQSFSQVAAGGNLIVPQNCLDKWFTKFSTKFRLDPDFLTRDKDKL